MRKFQFERNGRRGELFVDLFCLICPFSRLFSWWALAAGGALMIGGVIYKRKYVDVDGNEGD
ncbi:MAG: hypothetical protein C6P37_01710 [Caldibacillus debilis]|uniref:Uncharacterized protein n=1 Tax=Caldibacillus debilis TaxID=301148 RepID=A0A3E0K8C7_9BACI|nr:hypothetical protein [Bacillaceae bacterium]OUM88682.1 MAG: hypothetical protein BAA03_01210 [Caldibacillus debilis]REJ19091.1 MAG: hypothetical protein C6W57_01880 [Caldibacillus debilis]REJ31375.1 MAG: hypothetical protein C6P37_01710 [Caldibacillus debilis]